MTIRIFAAAAIVALAAGATTATTSAGTLQNGAWTPSGCTDPGDVPHFSSRSPEAYNKSAKTAQEWQGKARDYADCVNKDAKADQQAVVAGANGAIGKINQELAAMNDESKAAVDKLKKSTSR